MPAAPLRRVPSGLVEQGAGGEEREGASPAAGSTPLPRRKNNTMKIRPLQDRIVIKRLEGESVTKGGIIIPDSAKEKPVEATVIAVGSGKVLEDGTVRKLDVKEGDRVLFGKYSGSEVKIDGEEHLILREDDILGVIES